MINALVYKRLISEFKRQSLRLKLKGYERPDVVRELAELTIEVLGEYYRKYPLLLTEASSIVNVHRNEVKKFGGPPFPEGYEAMLAYNVSIIQSYTEIEITNENYGDFIKEFKETLEEAMA